MSWNDWQNEAQQAHRKIGERVKRLREEKGLSQDALAKEVGVSRSGLKEQEDGRQGMKADTVVRLAAILETSTDYILTGVEVENQTTAADLSLCNEAINRLKLERDFPDIPDILNFLLTSKEGCKMLSALWWYISTDFRTKLQYKSPKGEPVEVGSVEAFNEDFNESGSLMPWDIAAAVDERELNRIKGMIASLKDEFNQERERRKQKGGRKHDESED